MQHLKELLISLQTFDLKLLPSKEFKNDTLIAGTGLPMYDISHQIKVSKFAFDLRKLTDFATVDLLMLNSRQIKLAIVEFNKLKDRFDIFWKKYNLYYRGRSFTKYHFQSLYQDNYLILIGLPYFFYVNNQKASSPNILITGKFVDDLRESVRLRETFLAEITQHATSLITPEEAPTPEPAKAPEKSTRKIANKPTFKEGIADKFFDICKNYFSTHDQGLLLPLLKENEAPTFPLLFRGNGNQLVDAFKQVYEANLIVGCQKSELEEWIGANFEYVYRNEQKTFPANYLNAIISSNSKPCQSPILDVKKQSDGTFIIVPVLRTKRNYNSGR